MNSKLTKNNYLYLPNFIKSKRAKKLAKEFIEHARTNKLSGDPQVTTSHAEYNFMSFLELLCEKTPEITKFIGEPVIPTYTYARVYHNGSVLKKHTDREACEISLTVHLDGDSEWPIFIETPEGKTKSINLKPGDAVLYLGNVAPHWRDQFVGKEYTQVFLHYVRSQGECSFAYFDKVRENPTTNDVKETISMTESHVTDYKKSLNDYIVVFDSLVPIDLCDKILKEYKNSNDWDHTFIGAGIIDTSIRSADTILISYEHVIGKNPKIRTELDQRLFACAGEAITRYNEKFPLARIEEDSGYELLRYKKLQHYSQHTDSFKARPRAVSCSFMLNDDYEGGEFAFFDRELKYKPSKGSIIMFPSNFMYPHEIMPVTKGTRYSIITWFI